MPSKRAVRSRPWGRRLLVVATVAATLLGAVAWSWVDAHRPLTPPPEGALVAIADGVSFRIVSQRLGSAGVVRHPLNLRLWARWTGSDRQVRSGDYAFRRALTPLEVLATLRSGEGAVHAVTIPEGSTLRDIAAAFEAAGFGGSDQFLCAAARPQLLMRLGLPATGFEGYLFPDTYKFAWSTAPEQILAAMVGRYREQAAQLTERRHAARLSEQEMVTLASIIEKETGAAAERPLVSAVFRNRLRVGMRLQADPTAVYGRAATNAPTAADLDIDTPYNTYLHDGLPPGPICNPGRAALDAAVAPASVDYLYFVARGDGSHAFSRSLDEHNANVSALRRRQGGRP